MPHQCTDCGRTFDDGSQEMLSGCPDCGGNKFQYQPTSAVEETAPPSEEPPDPPDPPVDSSVARTVGNAATAVRDLVGSSPSPPEPVEDDSSDPAPAPAGTETGTASTGTEGVDAQTAMAEDNAQASARTEVVSKDELPPAPETPKTASQPAPVVEEDTDSTAGTAPDAADTSDERDRPDLSELRDELNDQFESIKVLDPGKYELNLMELYDREEYIIALQEDGKYTIQVPERWEDS